MRTESRTGLDQPPCNSSAARSDESAVCWSAADELFAVTYHGADSEALARHNCEQLASKEARPWIAELVANHNLRY
jgi:hypothetical protein